MAPPDSRAHAAAYAGSGRSTPRPSLLTGIWAVEVYLQVYIYAAVSLLRTAEFCTVQALHTGAHAVVQSQYSSRLFMQRADMLRMPCWRAPDVAASVYHCSSQC